MSTSRAAARAPRASAERLRAEAHCAVVEEAIPSLDDSGGVDERRYELVLTSMRLATRRRVADVVTNPGPTDCWVFKRFLEPGHRSHRVAYVVPAEDRLTPARELSLEARLERRPQVAAPAGATTR